MFDITYKGGNAVVISTRKSTLVTDPKLSLLGLKDVRPDDGIELATESRFALNADRARLHIDGPGEYEVGDFLIQGVAASRHIDDEKAEKIATIYRIVVEGVRIALLGNIAPTLTDDQLERLSVVDILIIPVGGGGYTLDATAAAGLVRQIEPRVVIPIHYKDDALTYEVPQDTLETFTKELSAPVADSVTKYRVKSPSVIPETLTVIPISRS